MNSRENPYDVSKYSDSELYDILDLDNPSDRVLEAKIIQMINKYTNIGGESGIKLTKFFKNIYNHFFENSDDEQEQNEEIFFNNDNQEQNDNIPQNDNTYYNKIKNIFKIDGSVKLQEGLQNNIINTSPNFSTQDDFNVTNPNIADIDNVTISNVSTTRLNISGNGTVNKTPGGSDSVNIRVNKSLSNTSEKDPSSTSDSITVNQLEYRKDTLNPLLKQTVKRIISIDSQYRDSYYNYSTDFTFNLSEPLKDVVAIRMYSMQIPYSWYTINNNYGGNFFYLKGNSAGIDNGSFDYKVSITPGNYSPNVLVDTINSSIKTQLKDTYKDISFGSTHFSYNNPENKASVIIDIRNNFNESDYAVVFNNDTTLNRYPTAIDENDNFLKYKQDGNSTISAYFGFNNISYSGNSISTTNTTINKLGNTLSTSIDDNNKSVYELNSTNNYFTIYQYTGSSYIDASNSNTILFNTKIILSLVDGKYTRNSIVNEINKQLSENTLLKNSSLNRIDITDISAQDSDYSTFKMDINWNKSRISTANVLNTKTAIVFPKETNTSSRIWIPGNSDIIYNCFLFPTEICEVNDIYAETEINQTNYIIKNKPYFVLKCNRPGYNTTYDYISNDTDPSGQDLIDLSNNRRIKNDYIVYVENSDDNGYNLEQYLNAINNSISFTNNLSKNTSNLDGIINLTSTRIKNDITTDNKVSLTIDINKTFKNSDGYYLDLSGSYLYNSLQLRSINNNVTNYEKIDLSTNYIFTSTISEGLGTYRIPSGNAIFKITPNPLSSNGNTTMLVNPTSYTATSLTSFTNMIQLSIKNYKDETDAKPLSNSTFTSQRNPNRSIVFTLNIIISKSLTESDYTLIFRDPSSAIGWSQTDANNSWGYNLKFAYQSYNLLSKLVTNYSEIKGISVLSGYSYYTKKLQTITIKAISNGVVCESNVNDVVLTIPSSPQQGYTIQELFSILNTQLTDNNYTTGSKFSLVTINNKNYIKLRLNINRLFKTEDYKLVFYDPFSFSKCVSGLTSGLNTTWDSTLGWILGFRNKTEYYLSEAVDFDLNNTLNLFTKLGNIVTLKGNTGVIISLYNYFLLILDDYTQSHLNDGLITLTKSYNELPVRDSIVSNTYECNAFDDVPVFTGKSMTATGNNFTQKQIYAENEKYLSKKLKKSDYTTGPYVKDVFALLPMKVTGLQVGATNVEFGGTLQNQERLYFGPVNIRRLSIKLVTDRGDILDLNGQDWSFSFICESLYQTSSI